MKGTSGTTAEFVALAEKISGQNLTDYANAWLYGSVRPTEFTLDGGLNVPANGEPDATTVNDVTTNGPAETSATAGTTSSGGENNETPDENNNNVKIIVAIVGIVVVAAIIVFVILSSKKKNNSSEEEK